MDARQDVCGTLRKSILTRMTAQEYTFGKEVEILRTGTTGTSENERRVCRAEKLLRGLEDTTG